MASHCLSEICLFFRCFRFSNSEITSSDKNLWQDSNITILKKKKKKRLIVLHKSTLRTWISEQKTRHPKRCYRCHTDCLDNQRDSINSQMMKTSIHIWYPKLFLSFSLPINLIILLISNPSPQFLQLGL